MTQTLNKIVVDCSTGEQTIVPLTEQELIQRELDAQAYAAQQAIQEAEEAAKAEAKASAESKLAALGLSAEEIAAITK
jgi:citrate lyase alpha subunit